MFADARQVGDALPPEAVEALGGETPQHDDAGSSAGAGPSGSPETPRRAPAGDDGQEATAPVASPSKAPDKGAPANAASPVPPTDDPLAGAEPFTFTVDGETQTMEGAYRLPGDGLYVPEDKVPALQLIASQAKSLERQNRALYERSQEWDRLTTWQTRRQDGVNPDGSARMVDETLTGRAAFEAQRSMLARSVATVSVLTDLLNDPNAIGKLIAGLDDQNNVVLDQERVDLLRERITNAAASAERSARDHLAKIAAPPPPAALTAADHAQTTIAKLIADHTIVGLPPEDIQFFQEEFPRYVVQQNGTMAVDPRLIAVMQRQAALRAEQRKVATTSANADKFKAGMDAGRQPAPARQPTAAPAPTPTGRNAPRARTEPTANDIWATLVNEAREATV